ncbi:unnamed protein product, partial [Prorocentrum cordatum]
MLEHLQTVGLAYTDWFKEDACAPHSQNRYGQGLDAMLAHKLLTSIALDGWAYSEAKGYAFEVSRDPAKLKLQLDFQDELHSSSDGMLPKKQKQNVKILTVGGSHTIATVSIVKNGAKMCEGVSHELANSEGYICKDKVLSKCGSSKQPLEKGMPFTVVRACVEDACPRLPWFLQDAMNKSHKATQEVTFVSTLMQIFNIAKLRTACNAEIDWDQIARDVAEDRPKLANVAHYLCKYVQNWAGGDTGHLLADLNDFWSSLTLRREVHEVTWKLMSDLSFLEGPDYVNALMKAIVTAPESFCSNGYSKLINGGDVADINGKKRIECVTACLCFEHARAYLDQISMLTQAEKVKVLGDFQIRTVCTIHGKKAKTRKNYDNIEAVKQAFLLDVSAIIGTAAMASIRPPWEFKPKQVAEESTGLRQFDGKGLNMTALQQLGFGIGSKVYEGSDPETAYTIMEFVDGVAKLQEDDGDDGVQGSVIEVPFGKLADTYQ